MKKFIIGSIVSLVCLSASGTIPAHKTALSLTWQSTNYGNAAYLNIIHVDGTTDACQVIDYSYKLNCQMPIYPGDKWQGFVAGAAPRSEYTCMPNIVLQQGNSVLSATTDPQSLNTTCQAH